MAAKSNRSQRDQDLSAGGNGVSLRKFLMRYGRYYQPGQFFYHRQMHRRMSELGYKVLSIRRLETHPVWEIRLKEAHYRFGFLKLYGLLESRLKAEVRLMLKELGRGVGGIEIGVVSSGDYHRVAFVWPVGQVGYWQPQMHGNDPCHVSLVARRWMREERN